MEAVLDDLSVRYAGDDSWECGASGGSILRLGNTCLDATLPEYRDGRSAERAGSRSGHAVSSPPPASLANL